MSLFENRAFRLALLVITIIVAFVWLRGLTAQETSSEERSDADPADIIETPTFPPAPEASPVVITPSAVTDTTDLTDSAVLEYVIEPGDTLGAIAVKFCTSTEAIGLANRGLDPGRLIAGQPIRIIGATTDCTQGTNPDTEREEGEESVYFVETGDNLGSIAEEYRVSLGALLDANPGVDAASIFPGQELTIPPIGTGLPAEILTPEPTAAVVQRDLGEAATHEVTDGDSIIYLATIYETTPEAILAANPGVDADSIFIGQVLNIPPPQR